MKPLRSRLVLLVLLSWIVSTTLQAQHHAGSDHAAKNGHSSPTLTGTQTIDLYSDGQRIHLLTVESDPEHVLHMIHRSSADDGKTWSQSHPIDSGHPMPNHPVRGFDPQIAAYGDHLVAAWSIGGTGEYGSGPIVTALSEDGGLSWHPGPNPADDGLTTGHSFIDLAVDTSGHFHMVWLDSRDGRQGLRYAESSDQGKSWSINRTLKADTCECCRNTLAIGAKGEIAVLFRDHNPRDMKVVTTEKRVWQKPVSAGEFGWQIEACPHTGGGLVITDSGIHSVVWTGREGSTGVYFVSLGEKPHRLADKNAIHPDLTAAKDGTLLAIWQERTHEGSVLRYTLSGRNQSEWSTPISVPNTDPSANHPLVVMTDQGFVIAWTESPEGAPAAWRTYFVPKS